MGTPLRFRAVIVFILALLAVPDALRAQGTVQGQETTIIYTGSVAPLASPNTPATQFSSPAGTNTFILPLSSPTVAVRVYITNQTANSCANAFTLTLWAASNSQVSSFNNNLANWQIIPLQNTSGTLSTFVNVNIPASSATYITSSAIVAPKIAIQLVNTTAGCATTNIEVVAVIGQISMTAPLISTASSNSFGIGGSASNVQGVVANNQSGGTVNPVITGGLQPAINTQFLSTGLDNTAASGVQTSSIPSNYNIVSVPSLQQTGEFALVWAFCPPPSSGSTSDPGWNAPAGSCTNTMRPFTLTNAISSTPFPVNYSGAIFSGQAIGVVATFPNGTTLTNQSGGGGSAASIGSVVIGEAPIVAYEFDNNPCAITSVTGVRGATYSFMRGFSQQKVGSGGASCILVFYASSPATSGGTETFTANGVTGTINNWGAGRLAGFSTTQPTQPAIAAASDTNGNQVIRLDAQAPNQFICNVTISTNTTTQCQPQPTVINNIPVRLYVTDMQVQTTVAGTTSQVTLVTGTGTNCGTGTLNLSAISYSDTALGLSNITGFRTPLVAPLQSAVCISQSGAVAGTATIEVHGFIAP